MGHMLCRGESRLIYPHLLGKAALAGAHGAGSVSFLRENFHSNRRFAVCGNV